VRGEIVPDAICAHTRIYSGLVPYGMPQPAPPPENLLEILGKVWWRLDKAIDVESVQAAARDYVARAARRHDDADRSSRIAQHDRRLAGNSWRSLPGARNSGGALLWRHRAKLWSQGSDPRLAECCRVYPLEHLMSLGALVPGSILAPGVYLSADQVRAADAHRCWFVHNPRSNEGNRVGYAHMLSYSTRVALGTDGWSAAMAEEEGALARPAEQNDDAGISGRLAGGHRLVAERFGTYPEPLAPGAIGDLVVRKDGGVYHVVVRGRLVVADGLL
jgi:hypothetical protein